MQLSKRGTPPLGSPHISPALSTSPRPLPVALFLLVLLVSALHQAIRLVENLPATSGEDDIRRSSLRRIFVLAAPWPRLMCR